ncbi:MAG: 23S rRNA (pseudouridine(1915)-N(3))-methyltransferase RlmH [Gemmatimonadaceae bacterium]|nr:23S rRNA (pseudouridine(1915)-N(3))-methyltransferase RlmH [Gemmatimonadaceae bacterium]
MRVSLLTVGKPRQVGLAEAIRDYESRAARYWPLDVIEVKEESARGATPEHVRAREADRLVERLAPEARVIACDPGGDTLDSTAFAHWLSSMRDAALSVAFVIGGAYGLGETVRARASRRMSLAPWTLPHELARLVLAEQLYRAGTIVRGEPYHK